MTHTRYFKHKDTVVIREGDKREMEEKGKSARETKKGENNIELFFLV